MSPPAANELERLHPVDPSNRATVRRMLAMAWRFRRASLGVLAQQAVLVACGLVGLGFTGLGIDVIRKAVDPSAAEPCWPFGLTPPADWPPLAVVALISGVIATFAAAQAALRFYNAITVARLSQWIAADLRSEIYAKLGQLSFRFFQANSSSAVINRVAGDAQAMRMFVDGVMLEVLSVVMSLAVFLTYMLSIHVGLTLCVLATTPLLWGLAVAFSRAVKPAYRRNRELSDQMIGRLSENVQGVSVVKGLGLEAREIDRFGVANNAVRDHKWTIFWKISLFQPTIYFFTKWNMAVLLAYGGYLVIRGELLLGEGLFVFANLLSQIAGQIEQVTNITNTIQSSIVGAQRVFDVLDAPVEIASHATPARNGRAAGAVRFERASFGYHPASSVLAEIDFEIQPGQCVAILGATGVGKTSLLNLIPRFNDVIAGRVLVDGIDVRAWNLDDLRRSIGVVFQESFLFSHTVAANIAFGRPDATRDQIERAARIAAAHEFIAELPHGYDTIIGEYGANLSGGQRQRLALARAVLVDPSILLLDDATASVDAETEHEILAALDRLMQGRTTFLVAHRASAIQRADVALVLDRGRVAFFGAPKAALEFEHGLARQRLVNEEAFEAAGAQFAATAFSTAVVGRIDGERAWKEAV